MCGPKLFPPGEVAGPSEKLLQHQQPLLRQNWGLYIHAAVCGRRLPHHCAAETSVFIGTEFILKFEFNFISGPNVQLSPSPCNGLIQH